MTVTPVTPRDFGEISELAVQDFEAMDLSDALPEPGAFLEEAKKLYVVLQIGTAMLSHDAAQQAADFQAMGDDMTVGCLKSVQWARDFCTRYGAFLATVEARALIAAARVATARRPG